MRPDALSSDASLLSSLAKAYEFMEYDVSLLSEGESRQFDALGVSPDAKRKTARDEAFTVIDIGDDQVIGFYRMPTLPNGGTTPDSTVLRDVSDMIKALRSKVTLLVALSDWGWLGEREYLADGDAIHPDVLLGSGLGSGVNGRVMGDDSCIWIRPYDKGRTLVELQVFSWPTRGQDVVWSEPDNYRVLSIGLGDEYVENPDVNAILK